MLLNIFILVLVFALGRITSGRYNSYDVYRAVDEVFIEEPNIAEVFLIRFMKPHVSKKSLITLVEAHRLKVVQRAIKNGIMVIREDDGKIILKKSDKKVS